MCHERQRLISYIYDECDPQDRLQIDQHLTGCSICQEELAGLRQVRQDLLAWDVPEHGSVWRPFAPPRPRLSWRDVPAWAMAAAASLLFLAGAAGGVATRAWLPASPAAPVVVATSTPVPTVALTPAQLAAIEARVAQRIRAELGSRPTPISATSMSTEDTQKVTEQLTALERDYLDWKDSQIEQNASQLRVIAQLTNRVNTEIVGMKKARTEDFDRGRVDFGGRVIPVSNSLP